MNELTISKLKKMVESNEIDTILVVFPDYFGRLMGKRVTASYFLKSKQFYCCDYLLSASMEMEPREGFKMASWEKGYGDLVFYVPDEMTLRRIPWLPKTVLVICDLRHEDGKPVEQAPRTILKRQCDKLLKRGLKAYMGSELEFHLFRDSYSEMFKNGYRTFRPSSDYRIDYNIMHTSIDEPIIRAIRNGMCEAGIPIESSKGECGNGQYEIGLLYSEALEMADRHVIYKNGAKEIALLNNVAITFMAKYKETESGSSCHIHTSIFNKETEKNIFWDEKTDKPSKEFRFFLGGLLALSRELFLFFAPTVNSYKRYREESFAPTRIVWSHDNRTTGFRIVGNKQSYRIENRMPGSDTNPYLAYAATIAAGLYGIDNKIDCGKEFVGNAYKAKNLPQIPRTLEEATQLFKDSKIARALFGDVVIDHYVTLAQLENETFHHAVTDWEMVRYFERI